MPPLESGFGVEIPDTELVVLSGSAPSAGAEVSFTIPGGYNYEILSFLVRLTTDATVVNRRSFLALSDGTKIFWRAASVGNQAASTAVDLVWSKLAGSNVGALGNLEASTAGILDAPLPAGFVLTTLTTGLQAGDQYGVPVLFVRRFTHRGETAELLETLRRLLEQTWREEYVFGGSE